MGLTDREMQRLVIYRRGWSWDKFWRIADRLGTIALWTAVVIVGLSLLTSCATTELTPLERQVRYEQQYRSCLNTGGIWYGYQYGYCKWSVQ